MQPPRQINILLARIVGIPTAAMSTSHAGFDVPGTGTNLFDGAAGGRRADTSRRISHDRAVRP